MSERTVLAKESNYRAIGIPIRARLPDCEEGADACARLGAIQGRAIDGVTFYRLRDVCDALGLPESDSARRCAYARIGAEHKRYIWNYKRTKSGKVYSDKRFCYIDRAGVEALILRYGGLIPRAALLKALP